MMRFLTGLIRIVFIFLFLLFVTGLIVGGSVIFYWSNQALALPTTSVLNMRVGGLNSNQVEARLAQEWRAKRIVLFTDEGSVLVAPADLGILFDAQATATAAVNQTTKATLTSLIEFWQGCRCVHPVWELDEAVMEAALLEQEGILTLPPLIGGIVFENGRLQITPSVAGTVIDLPTTSAYLRQNGSRVIQTGQLPVAIQVVEPQTLALDTQIEEINGRLAADLSLPLFDPIQNQQLDMVIPAIGSKQRMGSPYPIVDFE